MSISVNPSSLVFLSSASSQTVTVTSSNSNWSVNGSISWCTATKISNTQIRFTVTANTGGVRSYNYTVNYGSDVASISITQDGTHVSYNVSSMITPYKQITSQSSATTCACMCVKHSPNEVQAAGFNLDYANWAGIGDKYGYSVTGPSSASLAQMFRILAGGHPVIVKINDTVSSQHWVVVTQYSGSSVASLISANNFKCVDPYDGLTKTLSSATNYTGVYLYVLYEKK